MIVRTCGRGAAVAAVLLATAVPGPAHALRLLDEELVLGAAPHALTVVLAAKADGPLDFDLLGKPAAAPAPTAEDGRMRLRRRLLQTHQGVGLALLGMQVSTTVVGQLNYSDKFGTANTGRYVTPHAVLAYGTLGAFVLNGTLALLAPSPAAKPDRGWDRVRIHKVAMLVAAAGMLAQGVIGIQTDRREGYLDQASRGRTHLVVGYATLAAVGVGFGVLVF